MSGEVGEKERLERQVTGLVVELMQSIDNLSRVGVGPPTREHMKNTVFELQEKAIAVGFARAKEIYEKPTKG